MNISSLGFTALIAYLLVDFGQVHRMIPGVEYLFLGVITQALLIICVAAKFFTFAWVHPIATWRGLFLLSLFPGLIWGITQGRVAGILEAEIPRFLTGFLGACLFLRTVENLRFMFRFLTALSLVMAVWVLTHGGRGPGLYKDENDVALMLVMLMPLAYIQFVNTAQVRTKILSGLLLFVVLLGIGFTNSRGGMVGAVVVLALCWLQGKRKLLGLAIAGCLVIAAVVIAPEDLVSEFRTITHTSEGTAATRIQFWGLSIDLFQARPLFGVGAASWGNALYSGIIPPPSGPMMGTPHSVYFQLLSELGLVGTFAWLGFMISVALTLLRFRVKKLFSQMAACLTPESHPFTTARLHENSRFLHQFTLSLGLGIAGYLASGAFISVLYYPGLYFFAAFVQAAEQAWKNDLILASALSEQSAGNYSPIQATGKE